MNEEALEKVKRFLYEVRNAFATLEKSTFSPCYAIKCSSALFLPRSNYLEFDDDAGRDAVDAPVVTPASSASASDDDDDSTKGNNENVDGECERNQPINKGLVVCRLRHCHPTAATLRDEGEGCKPRPSFNRYEISTFNYN
ncbi:hypothetical protein RUM44_000728 [Polyplax serrata]|uniref:Uncharacterized protein n=1 Tax=Polyplax serrata TaxID=468196 RepID=A0ABR1B739_POLSC